MKKSFSVKNLSKTIIISKEILTTTNKNKVNLKNLVLRRFKNLIGTVAFTLAETLTVLSIMGIVAALTIPALYSRHTQTVNITKVKKSMTTYDAVIKRIKAENNLSTEEKFDNYVNKLENCGNTTKYFIKTEGNGCRFKTSDGVWWDLTNIKRPVIAFSQKAINDATASEADYKNSFYFVSSFDDENILRVNDFSYENGANAQILAHLFDFVNKTDKYSTELANNTSETNNNNLTDLDNTENTNTTSTNENESIETQTNTPKSKLEDSQSELYNPYPNACPADVNCNTVESYEGPDPRCKACTNYNNYGSTQIAYADDGRILLYIYPNWKSTTCNSSGCTSITRNAVQKFNYNSNNEYLSCDMYDYDTGELIQKNSCNFPI